MTEDADQAPEVPEIVKEARALSQQARDRPDEWAALQDRVINNRFQMLINLRNEKDPTMRAAVRDSVEELRILQQSMREDAWQAEQRRQADATQALAQATNAQADSLTKATKVLAWATVGLFIATVVLVIITATSSG
jgi:hypothetical protein